MNTTTYTVMKPTIQVQDLCLAIHLSNGYIIFADAVYPEVCPEFQDLIFTPRGCAESPTARERVAMANVVKIMLGVYPMS